MTTPKRSLEERVTLAARAALDKKKFVSPIDILIGIGWLQPGQVLDWRRRRVPCLESVVQTNLHRITMAMKIFHAWAERKGLVPSRTAYLARTRGPKVELRFSKSGNPTLEERYRTHYISPEISPKKRDNLREKLSKAPELVVYRVIRDRRCSKCGEEIQHGSLLYVEGDGPLCMSCAGMEDLVFVPSIFLTFSDRSASRSPMLATETLVIISQQGRENGGRIETGHAHEIDAAIHSHQRDRAQVPDKAVVFDRFIALLSEVLPGHVALPPHKRLAGCMYLESKFLHEGSY